MLFYFCVWNVIYVYIVFIFYLDDDRIQQNAYIMWPFMHWTLLWIIDDIAQIKLSISSATRPTLDADKPSATLDP